MNRFFIKKLVSTEVPNVFTGTVASALGDNRYRVIAGDGTIIEASSVSRLYVRGELVRLRGTEIIGLIKSRTNIKKYEV